MAGGFPKMKSAYRRIALVMLPALMIAIRRPHAHSYLTGDGLTGAITEDNLLARAFGFR
jgi:hypothetical protein